MIDPEKYGRDILDGKNDVCEYVYLSVQRHYDDLKKDWDYYFDFEAGLRPIKFFHLLRLYEGEMAGKRFAPEGWQAWCMYMIFGWKRKEDGGRRFKYVYIEVPPINVVLPFFRGTSM